MVSLALAVLELNSVNQTGLTLRDPPASASGVPGLKTCAATATWPTPSFLNYVFLEFWKLICGPHACSPSALLTKLGPYSSGYFSALC